MFHVDNSPLPSCARPFLRARLSSGRVYSLGYLILISAGHKACDHGQVTPQNSDFVSLKWR